MTSDQQLQALIAENVTLRSRITNLVAEAEIQERKWKVRVDREAGRVLLRDEAIEALAQRCIDLAAESASFESRWRELGEAFSMERARRQACEAELAANRDLHP